MNETDMPGPEPSTTTVVKNWLRHPDGTSWRGMKITLIVRASSTWDADGTGRIVGRVTTWTNDNGCWRAELLPYTSYREDQYVYVQVNEGDLPETVSYIRVPPILDGQEQWLWDLLITPPDPTPQPDPPVIRLGQVHDVAIPDPHNGDALIYRDGKWHAAPVAAKLAQLLDVDIHDAPDGSVLVKHGDRWVAEPARMRTLTDVNQSVDWAEQGDPLTYLSGGQGWGVARDKPHTIEAQAGNDPGNPARVWVSVTGFDQTLTLNVSWFDGDPEPHQTIPEPGDYAHDYTTPGAYTIRLYYTDGSEELPLPVTIPEGT